MLDCHDSGLAVTARRLNNNVVALADAQRHQGDRAFGIRPSPAKDDVDISAELFRHVSQCGSWARVDAMLQRDQHLALEQGTRRGGTRGEDNRRGGAKRSGTRSGGNTRSGARRSGSRSGGNTRGGARRGGTRSGGNTRGGARHGGSRSGGTRGENNRRAGARRGGARSALRQARNARGASVRRRHHLHQKIPYPQRTILAPAGNVESRGVSDEHRCHQALGALRQQIEIKADQPITRLDLLPFPHMQLKPLPRQPHGVDANMQEDFCTVFCANRHRVSDAATTINVPSHGACNVVP